ncbi:MAG: histidine kinase [Rhizobiales bacterium PAR1]|nr:MAG: histidine kinase [Rhizobiales bacterium PAR1]
MKSPADRPTPEAVHNGLSARLLWLTGLFVLFLSAVIYVPSMATFRDNWLGERLSQARAAALILEKAPPDSLPKPLVDELLSGMETTMIAIRIDNMRRLLAVSDMPPMVDFEIDLRQRDAIPQLMSAFNTLFFGGNRTMRVVGPPPRGGDFVEIVIPEGPLRAAMLRFSWTMLAIALTLSTLTALAVFVTLNGLIVGPVKRLAAAVSRFRADPADSRALLPVSHRRDEFGTLERAVSEMQNAVQQELRQRERLANLGLAVAKINHDLRNMLASAQLMADRLGSLPDQNVQRFVPKLLSALDRAIHFCQSTLAYGRAEEQQAHIAAVKLLPIVTDVAELMDLSPATRPSLTLEIPGTLCVQADSEHLHRVITNLVRNARAALDTMPFEAKAAITIRARLREGVVEIDVHDTGPGIPAQVREKLFRAFSGSSRPGGTGLGLAIAQELIRGMGGSIVLLSPEIEGAHGTTFRLSLPAA